MPMAIIFGLKARGIAVRARPSDIHSPISNAKRDVAPCLAKT